MVVGWTREQAVTLRDKLAKTNCKLISQEVKACYSIELCYKRSGWGIFSYLVFDEPITDNLVERYECEAISKSGFGSKVLVEYEGSL